MDVIPAEQATDVIYKTGYNDGHGFMLAMGHEEPQYVRGIAQSQAWHSFKDSYDELRDHRAVVEVYTRGFAAAVTEVLEGWGDDAAGPA